MKPFKITAFLISIIIIISGCKTGTPEASSSPSEQKSKETGTEISFPLDEAVNLSVWMPFTSSILSYPGDIKANIEVERRTNVHVEYTLSTPAEAAANFALMMATEIYSDILFMQDSNSATTYIGGHEKAIEDGVFLKLNDLIDKWAPNYKSLLESNEEIYKQSTTDSGNQAVFARIHTGNRPPWLGPVIRKDLLEAAGLGIPKTYDELYNALVVFKDNSEIEQPLSIYHQGYNPTTHTLTSGFNIAPGFYNENGNVKYGFIESGFRDFLTMMNRWYEEGLIDPQFSMRKDDFLADPEEMSQGKIGAVEHGFYTTLARDPRFVAMPLPRQNAGDTLHFRMVNKITGNTPAALTTKLLDDEKRLQIAVKWMDYRYSEEGARIINYGVQGESFRIVEGRPQFTQFIYNNPDNSFADMIEAWTDPEFGSYYMWERENIALTPAELTAYKVWAESASGDWMMPPLTLTDDEAGEFDNIYNDITHFVNANVYKFINGNIPISQFNSFVSEIEDMNIARCIEIQQAALERYNARGR